MKAKSKNLPRMDLREFYDFLHQAAGDYSVRNSFESRPAQTLTIRFSPPDEKGGRRYKIKAGCK